MTRKLFPMAAALVLAASCSEQVEFCLEQPEESIVFTATILNSDVKTQIAIDGSVGKTSWLEGDEISINGIAYVAEPESEGATATFTKKNSSDPDPESPYVATYRSVSWQIHDAYHPGSNNPLRAESATTELQFSAPCGLLKLEVKDDDGKDVIAVSAGSSTLFCGNGIALDASDATDFYIALPADDYDNLCITFYASDGSYANKTFKSTVSIAQGSIQPVSFSNLVFRPGGFVDMGLSVKWAASNLSDAVGSLFAWAEPPRRPNSLPTITRISPKR